MIKQAGMKEERENSCLLPRFCNILSLLAARRDETVNNFHAQDSKQSNAGN